MDWCWRMVSIKHNNTVLIHDGTWTERERVPWNGMAGNDNRTRNAVFSADWLASCRYHTAGHHCLNRERQCRRYTSPSLPRVLSRGRLYVMVSHLIGVGLDLVLLNIRCAGHCVKWQLISVWESRSGLCYCCVLIERIYCKGFYYRVLLF